jgi:glucose/arabinose dehydrogenase
MRRLVWLWLFAACGDNQTVTIVDARPELGCTPSQGGDVTLRKIVSGCSAMDSPPRPNCIDDVVTLVTSPPKDPRVFELEIHGTIRIIENDQLRVDPFLDISSDNGGPVFTPPDIGESGLLGLVFHPDYAHNRQFYVYYVRVNQDLMDPGHPWRDEIARYTTSATDPYKADLDTAQVVLSIPDPFLNHNGGMMEFGPDGYLYISTGDGGGRSATETGRPNAQDLTSRLGKILRIDVDHPDPGMVYSVPADNPFVGTSAMPEVFMRGLRNPWRWSFDVANGDMWIGDVGEGTWEELDYLPAGKQAGVDLGWVMYEGNSCFMPPCDPTGMTFPVEVHNHSEGWWAIIGGEVYRGRCFPDQVGYYFYTDCGYGYTRRGRMIGGGFVSEQLLQAVTYEPTTLHADGLGELWEADVKGNIFRIVEKTQP